MTSDFQFMSADSLAQLSLEERTIYFRKVAEALQRQIHEARAAAARSAGRKSEAESRK